MLLPFAVSEWSAVFASQQPIVAQASFDGKTLHSTVNRENGGNFRPLPFARPVKVPDTVRASPSRDAKRKEGIQMRRRKLMWVVLCGSATMVTALYVGKALATPASLGFVGTTLALGRLSEFNVYNQLVPQGAPPWLSLQITKGSSDLYVQNNVWQPGASTGWHSHPGHSLIIVTAGTLSDYESSDPNCTPTVYTQGMAFVDPGGDHVHNIRNEGGGVASNIAVQLIPAGTQRRIDAPQPANCPSFPPF